MRTLRLFKILDWLRSQRYPVSAEQMAEKLDVSVRTIYRDMATLQSMGAPIRGEGGIGYQIERGYFLPPLQFDDDELDAIVLGIRMVSARGDDALAEAATRALGKINTVLSEERRNFERPLLAVGKEFSGEALALLSPLRSAIRDRLKTEITYCDLKERETIRVVRPLGLIAFEAVWVLAAWCEKQSDFRNFRIDRISSADIGGERFAPERGKEFSDYLKEV